MASFNHIENSLGPLRQSGRALVILALFLSAFPALFASPAPFDVVVYGGTASGTMAAIAAAQCGLRVALLEPGQHIGGMVTGGLSSSDVNGQEQLIGGLAREFTGTSKGSGGSSTGSDAIVSAQPRNVFATLGSVSYQVGKHSLKFGGDWRLIDFNEGQNSNPSGTFNFTRAFTQGPNAVVTSPTSGFGFASFLLGNPTSGSVNRINNISTQDLYYAAYLQDDWRVSGHLTLNLGLRWDVCIGNREKYDRLAYFNLTAPNPLGPPRRPPEPHRPPRLDRARATPPTSRQPIGATSGRALDLHITSTTRPSRAVATVFLLASHHLRHQWRSCRGCSNHNHGRLPRRSYPR